MIAGLVATLPSTTAQDAPVTLYFRSVTAPVGNVDYAASGSLLSPTAPTDAVDSVAGLVCFDGGNARTIYDASFQSTTAFALTGHSVKVSWWTLNVGNGAQSWKVDIYLGGTGTANIVASKLVTAPMTSGAAQKIETTFDSITTEATGLLTVIVDPSDPGQLGTGCPNTAHVLPVVLYDTVAHASQIVITPPAPTSLVESFAISAVGPAPEATPGGSATTSLRVANTGAGEQAFALSAADLPDGVSSAFDPPNGTLAAASNLTANVTVTVPADVATGSYAFNVTVAGPNGGNASIALTLTVTAVEPSPSPSSSPDPTEGTDPTSTDGGNPTDPAAGNETGNGTAAAGGDAGGIPSPSATLAGLAVAAALVIVLGRRRKIE